MFSRKKTITVRIEAQIFWLARQNPATGRWLAVCPPLNLNAEGDTYAQLQACGNEATALLFQDLVEDGELATFLHKNGWQMIGVPQPGTRTQFDIPADWRSHAPREEVVAYA